MTDSDKPRIYRLLMRLRGGGALVRAADCTSEEVALAMSQDRYTLDADGHGYVWRPPARNAE